MRYIRRDAEEMSATYLSIMLATRSPSVKGQFQWRILAEPRAMGYARPRSLRGLVWDFEIRARLSRAWPFQRPTVSESGEFKAWRVPSLGRLAVSSSRRAILCIAQISFARPRLLSAYSKTDRCNEAQVSYRMSPADPEGQTRGRKERLSLVATEKLEVNREPGARAIASTDADCSGCWSRGKGDAALRCKPIPNKHLVPTPNQTSARPTDQPSPQIQYTFEGVPSLNHSLSGGRIPTYLTPSTYHYVRLGALPGDGYALSNPRSALSTCSELALVHQYQDSQQD
ncbi:hypothetical protein DFP72DRAFT_1054507 [Ephemerocybe angulata]|uniref:Uncharacterized protein n=1 Tax=Ephemerocybe angulata TaxID=980116 RepID=A0A8H6H7U2_9AGAR|nr:hypothetical protein DFP72DRAFT_1054507 [Tulosesus angulatus]